MGDPWAARAARWEVVPVGHDERRQLVAAYWCFRFRALAREEGTAVAANRLKKYGVPVWIALRILGIEPLLTCSGPWPKPRGAIPPAGNPALLSDKRFPSPNRG